MVFKYRGSSKFSFSFIRYQSKIIFGFHRNWQIILIMDQRISHKYFLWGFFIGKHQCQRPSLVLAVQKLQFLGLKCSFSALEYIFSAQCSSLLFYQTFRQRCPSSRICAGCSFPLEICCCCTRVVFLDLAFGVGCSSLASYFAFVVQRTFGVDFQTGFVEFEIGCSLGLGSNTCLGWIHQKQPFQRSWWSGSRMVVAVVGSMVRTGMGSQKNRFGCFGHRSSCCFCDQSKNCCICHLCSSF